MNPAGRPMGLTRPDGSGPQCGGDGSGASRDEGLSWHNDAAQVPPDRTVSPCLHSPGTGGPSWTLCCFESTYTGSLPDPLQKAVDGEREWWHGIFLTPAGESTACHARLARQRRIRGEEPVIDTIAAMPKCGDDPCEAREDASAAAARGTGEVASKHAHI